MSDCRRMSLPGSSSRAPGPGEGLPRNLAILHSPPLKAVAVQYWARTMRSPAGGLCFAATPGTRKPICRSSATRWPPGWRIPQQPATCASSCSPPLHEPALRDIPRLIPLHRLIWRDKDYGQQPAPEPAAAGSAAAGRP